MSRLPSGRIRAIPGEVFFVRLNFCRKPVGGAEVLMIKRGESVGRKRQRARYPYVNTRQTRKRIYRVPGHAFELCGVY